MSLAFRHTPVSSRPANLAITTSIIATQKQKRAFQEDNNEAIFMGVAVRARLPAPSITAGQALRPSPAKTDEGPFRRASERRP
jgi:hypothetical protein